MIVQCTSNIGCPDFDVEPETRVTDNSIDVAAVDPGGQHPNMADQLASVGVSLTALQWSVLSRTLNPSWKPTYTRQVVNDKGQGVEHLVAVCPKCGTPVKVG